MKECIRKHTMSSSPTPGGIVYIKFDELTDLTSIKSGGYGLIYKASHTRLGTVAYKEIKVESAERHEASLLQDEAKIHFGLNHENVVKMHGLIFGGSNFGLVLEFMDNGDLVEFIRIHKPGHETKLKLLSEVASGMRFLHEQSPPIIHGDLKGTNVLISQDIHAKVNDFGFSRTKEYSQSTSLHNVRLGTVTHIPPENWENPYLRKTERFDVYGFGIMIWEVMTEEKPYSEAQGNAAVISAWVQHGTKPNMSKFPAVPEIFQSLQLLMQRCWHQHHPMRPNFSKIGQNLEELASTGKEIIPKILKKRQPVIPTERNVKSSTAPRVTTGVSCAKIAERGVTRQMNSSTSGRNIWEGEQRGIPLGIQTNLKSSTAPNVTTGEIPEPAVTSAMKSSSRVINETKPDVTSGNFPKPGVNCMKKSSGVQHETTFHPGFSNEKSLELEVACEKKSSSDVTNHYENFETSLGGSVPYEHGVGRQKKSTSGSSYETIIPSGRVGRSDITSEEFIPVVVTRENISTSECTSGMMFVPEITRQIIQMNDISTSANKKTPELKVSASGFSSENIPNPEETVEKAFKKPLCRSLSTGSQTKSSASLQDQLDEQCWYFGDQTICTKDVCEDMLGAFIEKDGTFLVRKNKDGGPNQPYTLSIVYHQKVIHARIHFTRLSNTYSLGTDAAPQFESVPILISYYQNNSLIFGGNHSVKLGQTVPKLTE